MRVVFFDGNLFLDNNKFFSIMDRINFVKDILYDIPGLPVIVWQKPDLVRVGRVTEYKKYNYSLEEIKFILNYISDFFESAGISQFLFPDKLTLETIYKLLSGPYWVDQIKEFIIVTDNLDFMGFCRDNVFVYIVKDKIMYNKKLALIKYNFTAEELFEELKDNYVLNDENKGFKDEDILKIYLQNLNIELLKQNYPEIKEKNIWIDLYKQFLDFRLQSCSFIYNNCKRFGVNYNSEFNVNKDARILLITYLNKSKMPLVFKVKEQIKTVISSCDLEFKDDYITETGLLLCPDGSNITDCWAFCN